MLGKALAPVLCLAVVACGEAEAPVGVGESDRLPVVIGTWSYRIEGAEGGGWTCSPAHGTLILDQPGLSQPIQGTHGGTVSTCRHPEYPYSSRMSMEREVSGRVYPDSIVIGPGASMIDANNHRYADILFQGSVAGDSMRGTVSVRLRLDDKISVARGPWAAGKVKK